MKLSVENGSFYYHRDTPVFDSVDFSVSSGEILAILGPNGAGKTTLLRCITGMLPWRGGCSRLDAQDIRKIPGRKLWQRMAYVPQARSAQAAYTVFETVLLGRSSHLNVFSPPAAADVEKAREVLELLDIGHLAQKKCSAISGGELQMVLIARALASEPEVLILDEPESNLDFRNQLIVLDTVTRLARQGMACVFNTHYPAHALQRAHKALLLHHGSAVFGETAAVVTQDNIRRAFGVDAVIGQVETPQRVLQSVVPLSVSQREDAADADPRSIATTTILASSNHAAEDINAILHEYGPMIIGRMGMPYRECGVYIIHVTLDARAGIIRELTHRLSLIPGISVKTTFAPGEFPEVSP